MRFELRVHDFYFAIEMGTWYGVGWRFTDRYIWLNLLLVGLYAGKDHWNEARR